MGCMCDHFVTMCGRTTKVVALTPGVGYFVRGTMRPI